MLSAENCSKKHLLLEKREQFENGQNRPRCLGSSPCKMLSLGQKLKMAKRCEKRFFDFIKAVVRKSRSKKKLILEKREQFENGQNRPMQNAQFGSKIENAKKVRKTII